MIVLNLKRQYKEKEVKLKQIYKNIVKI